MHCMKSQISATSYDNLFIFEVGIITRRGIEIMFYNLNQRVFTTQKPRSLFKIMMQIFCR